MIFFFFTNTNTNTNTNTQTQKHTNTEMSSNPTIWNAIFTQHPRVPFRVIDDKLRECGPTLLQQILPVLPMLRQELYAKIEKNQTWLQKSNHHHHHDDHIKENKTLLSSSTESNWDWLVELRQCIHYRTGIECYRIQNPRLKHIEGEENEEEEEEKEKEEKNIQDKKREREPASVFLYWIPKCNRLYYSFQCV